MTAVIAPAVGTRFVGARAADLVAHAREHDSSPAELFTVLETIGSPFDVPWGLTDALPLLADVLPGALYERLDQPSRAFPENHVEACAVAMAREGGVVLAPFDRAGMRRLQHSIGWMIESERWERRSLHPWDAVSSAELGDLDFFALAIDV